MFIHLTNHRYLYLLILLGLILLVFLLLQSKIHGRNSCIDAKRTCVPATIMMQPEGT